MAPSTIHIAKSVRRDDGTQRSHTILFVVVVLAIISILSIILVLARWWRRMRRSKKIPPPAPPVLQHAATPRQAMTVRNFQGVPPPYSQIARVGDVCIEGHIGSAHQDASSMMSPKVPPASLTSPPPDPEFPLPRRPMALALPPPRYEDTSTL
ncbi:hypothetical protein CYLTODRAFT_418747, partial [Cylindrobasidium torrendii FP15055 ss-10]